MFHEVVLSSNLTLLRLLLSWTLLLWSLYFAVKMSTPAHSPSPHTVDIATIVSYSVLLGLALILVFLRLYVRARILHALGWDDFFMVLALVRLTPSKSRDFTELTIKLQRFLLSSPTLPLSFQWESQTTYMEICYDCRLIPHGWSYRQPRR